MNLDGDADDDLDRFWGELEPDVQITKSPYPPTRGLGYLFLLAAGIGGLQGVFALIFSNGAAHLRYLNLSKPAQALVWIAGPLAGITVQPYCGIWSDQCLSPWGRRRPFIVSGAVATVTSLLGLAWSERVASIFVRLWAGDTHLQEDLVKAVAAYMTVFFFVSLNIALQPLQGGLRALTADMCPREQSPTAAAVASGVISASNILSYGVGFIELRRIAILRTLGGDSQFAMLCIITSGALAVSVGLTCLSVQESSAEPDDEGLYRRSTYNTARAQLWYLCTCFPRLPRQVQQVFKVQFFSWMGWFPFLFYAATYMSETYKSKMIAIQRSSMDTQATAARMSSLGLMVFALVALVAVALVSIAHRHASRGRQNTVTIGAFTRLTGSIRRLWIFSQALFAICMFATAFISSLTGVYIIVGVSGISWAVTIWAPYALINSEIIHDTGLRRKMICSQPLMQYDECIFVENDVVEIDKEGDDEYDCSEGENDAHERRPGIILGLHNVAIAGPQILAAASCSLIFWMLEDTSQDSVAWTLQAGGLAALGAAIVARGLHDNTSELT